MEMDDTAPQPLQLLILMPHELSGMYRTASEIFFLRHWNTLIFTSDVTIFYPLHGYDTCDIHYSNYFFNFPQRTPEVPSLLGGNILIILT